MRYLFWPCEVLSVTIIKEHADREYRDMGDFICCLKRLLIGLNEWQKYSMTNETLFVRGPLKEIPYNNPLLANEFMCYLIYWFFLQSQCIDTYAIWRNHRQKSRLAMFYHYIRYLQIFSDCCKRYCKTGDTLWQRRSYVKFMTTDKRLHCILSSCHICTVNRKVSTYATGRRQT